MATHPRARACYNAGLKEDPNISGRVVISIQVGPSGDVTGASVAQCGLNAKTCACIAAGARFIVSPIVDEATIAECRGADIAVMPGALTPTEIVRAWRAGADLVKVFPCSAVGGASYIKALRAPLPQIPLVPTGGVTLETIAAFFAAGSTAVGVGADLCNVSAVRLGQAHQITDAARAYVRAVQTAREAA